MFWAEKAVYSVERTAYSVFVVGSSQMGEPRQKTQDKRHTAGISR